MKTSDLKRIRAENDGTEWTFIASGADGIIFHNDTEIKKIFTAAKLAKQEFKLLEMARDTGSVPEVYRIEDEKIVYMEYLSVAKGWCMLDDYVKSLVKPAPVAIQESLIAVFDNLGELKINAGDYRPDNFMVCVLAGKEAVVRIDLARGTVEKRNPQFSKAGSFIDNWSHLFPLLAAAAGITVRPGDLKTQVQAVGRAARLLKRSG